MLFLFQMFYLFFIIVLFIFIFYYCFIYFFICCRRASVWLGHEQVRAAGGAGGWGAVHQGPPAHHLPGGGANQTGK